MCSPNIRETSRGSKGVKLVNLSQKDFLVGVSEVVELDEKDAEQTDATEEIAENNLIVTIMLFQIQKIFQINCFFNLFVRR